MQRKASQAHLPRMRGAWLVTEASRARANAELFCACRAAYSHGLFCVLSEPLGAGGVLCTRLQIDSDHFIVRECGAPFHHMSRPSMCLRQSQARSAWPFTSGARLSLGLLFTDQPHVTSPIIACTQPPKRDARTQSRHPAPTDSSVSVCLPPANTINIQLRDRRLRAALGRSERCCAPFRGLCRAVFYRRHVVG